MTKLALALLTMLFLAACEEETTPTAPQGPTNQQVQPDQGGSTKQ